ncbi:MAG: GNAT family N-acetyltransferase, partial [Candidatus Omnitrophica bacterium]|nr:GNAT family N-acetyltransferase [Candidatus Omnitrophota bacterium]
MVRDYETVFKFVRGETDRTFEEISKSFVDLQIIGEEASNLSSSSVVKNLIEELKRDNMLSGQINLRTIALLPNILDGLIDTIEAQINMLAGVKSPEAELFVAELYFTRSVYLAHLGRDEEALRSLANAVRNDNSITDKFPNISKDVMLGFLSKMSGFSLEDFASSALSRLEALRLFPIDLILKELSSSKVKDFRIEVTTPINNNDVEIHGLNHGATRYILYDNKVRLVDIDLRYDANDVYFQLNVYGKLQEKGIGRYWFEEILLPYFHRQNIERIYTYWKCDEGPYYYFAMAMGFGNVQIAWEDGLGYTTYYKASRSSSSSLIPQNATLLNSGMPLYDLFNSLIRQQVSAGIAKLFDDKLAHYIDIDGGYRVQVNPLRDPALRTVIKRGRMGECFLCAKNQPDGEVGIPLNESWTVYANPSPYEKAHVVIVQNLPEDHRNNGSAQYIRSEAELFTALNLIWLLAVESETLPSENLFASLVKELMAFIYRLNSLNLPYDILFTVPEHLRKRPYNISFNSEGAGNSSDHFHYQGFEVKLPVESWEVESIKEGNGVEFGRIANKPMLTYTFGNGFIKIFVHIRGVEAPGMVVEGIDESLAKVKFGICEMSGMAIVYKDEMAKMFEDGVFEKLLSIAGPVSLKEKIEEYKISSALNKVAKVKDTNVVVRKLDKNRVEEELEELRQVFKKSYLSDSVKVDPDYLDFTYLAFDEDEGKIIGGFQWIPSDKKVDKWSALAVLPEYRGYGIGKKLFFQVVDLTRQQGLSVLWIDSTERAWTFYEKCGAKLSSGQPSFGDRVYLEYLIKVGVNRESSSSVTNSVESFAFVDVDITREKGSKKVFNLRNMPYSGSMDELLGDMTKAFDDVRDILLSFFVTYYFDERKLSTYVRGLNGFLFKDELPLELRRLSEFVGSGARVIFNISTENKRKNIRTPVTGRYVLDKGLGYLIFAVDINLELLMEHLCFKYKEQTLVLESIDYSSIAGEIKKVFDRNTSYKSEELHEPILIPEPLSWTNYSSFYPMGLISSDWFRYANKFSQEDAQRAIEGKDIRELTSDEWEIVNSITNE